MFYSSGLSCDKKIIFTIISDIIWTLMIIKIILQCYNIKNFSETLGLAWNLYKKEETVNIDRKQHTGNGL